MHTITSAYPRKKSLQASGFTLIEVMITVTLLALIMAVAWGSFLTMERSQTYTQNINDRMHAAEQAMNRMVRELSMAFMTAHGLPPSELAITAATVTTTTDPNVPPPVQATPGGALDTWAGDDPAKVVYRTGFYGERDRVDFTCLCNVRMVRDEKTSDQAEVSYYLKNIRRRDGTYVEALMRRLDAPIDDDPRKGGFVMPILEDVKKFEIEYWDDAKAATSVGDDAWVSSWDTESSDTQLRLPSRVRIRLEIPHPNNPGQTLTFTTQAEIHLTQIIDF